MKIRPSIKFIIADRILIYLLAIWIMMLATVLVLRGAIHIPGDQVVKLNRVLELCEGSLAPAKGE